MTKEELYTMAEKYTAKAERAYMNYQETGLARYDRDRRNAEELADALRIAAQAMDEHTTLTGLKSEIYSLANMAVCAKNDCEKLENLRRNLLALARVYGLFQEKEIDT